MSKDKQHQGYIPTSIVAPTSFIGLRLIQWAIKQPLYSLKTRVELDPTRSNARIAKEIYAARGIKGFYRASCSAIRNIFIVETYRSWIMILAPFYYEKLFPNNNNSIASNYHLKLPFITFVDSVINCPLFRSFTYQLTHKPEEPALPIGKTLKNLSNLPGGYKELYRGFVPLSLQNAYFWWSFFFIDDLRTKYNQQYDAKLVNLTSYFSAGALACIIDPPINTIRIQMQKADSSATTFREAYQNFVKRHGTKGLYAGLPHKVIGSTIDFAMRSWLREHLLQRESEELGQSLQKSKNWQDTVKEQKADAKEIRKLS